MPRRSSDPFIPLADEPLKLPPERLPDGSINREFYRAQLENLNKLNAESLRTTGEPLKNLKQAADYVLFSAKLGGIDPKVLVDNRNENERVVDTLEKMMDGSSGADAILEQVEATIAAVEKAFDAAVEGCKTKIDTARENIDDAARVWRARRLSAEQGKRWLSLLERVKKLRDQAKNPFPKGAATKDADAWHASHILRFMAYVYRSDLGRGGGKPAANVVRIAEHHCSFAYHLWKCRNGVKFYSRGNFAETNAAPHIFTLDEKGRGLPAIAKKNTYQYKGLLIACPPRHGKSMFGTAFAVLEINNNPRSQGMMTHAQEDKCEENFRHVKAAFEPDNAIGRRNLSLFPAELDKTDNSKGSLRIKLDERTRDATLRAKGVRSNVGGANTDWQWWDDPVKPEEAQQSEEREATKRKLSFQFLQRLQGPHPFLLATFTPWHHDDAMWSMQRQIEKEEIPYCSIIRTVGGPKSSPPFYPLWKDEYPSSWLRTKYKEMNSPSDYAAQYMMDPRPEEMRIIKRIKLYDRNAPEHVRFMQQAESHHLSLDPTATSRDRVKRHTDKSGMVYAAVGHLIEREDTIDREMESNVRRVIRFISFREFHAGPTEGVEEIGKFAAVNPVDVVHVEVVNFSWAIVEDLKNRYGLTNGQVIPHPTGNKSKETRLRGVATMLDDSSASEGVAGAVAEFPGELNDKGELVIAPEFTWVEDQILNFGVVKGDHVIDAITQLLKHLGGSVKSGSGSVTEKVLLEHLETGPERTRRLLAESYASEDRNAEMASDPIAQEVQFMTGGRMYSLS